MTVQYGFFWAGVASLWLCCRNWFMESLNQFYKVSIPSSKSISQLKIFLISKYILPGKYIRPWYIASAPLFKCNLETGKKSWRSSVPLKFARSYSPEKKGLHCKKKKNFVYRILRLTSQAPRYFKKYSKNCLWTINKWINPAPGVFVVLFNRLRYEKDKHFLKDYKYHFFFIYQKHI